MTCMATTSDRHQRLFDNLLRLSRYVRNPYVLCIAFIGLSVTVVIAYKQIRQVMALRYLDRVVFVSPADKAWVERVEYLSEPSLVMDAVDDIRNLHLGPVAAPRLVRRIEPYAYRPTNYRIFYALMLMDERSLKAALPDMLKLYADTRLDKTSRGELCHSICDADFATGQSCGAFDELSPPVQKQLRRRFGQH